MGIKEMLEQAKKNIEGIDFLNLRYNTKRENQKKINEAYRLIDRVLKFWEEE